MYDFQQTDKRGMAKSLLTTLLRFYGYGMLLEVQFEYRGRFTNNVGKMKNKGVVIFPAVFNKSRFISLFWNIEFVFIQMGTQSTLSSLYIQKNSFPQNLISSYSYKHFIIYTDSRNILDTLQSNPYSPSFISVLQLYNVPIVPIKLPQEDG